jgi:hypothetical protein
MATEPIPFLDLPKELWLMVYEFIPIATRHRVLRDFTLEYTATNPDDALEGASDGDSAAERPSTITLVSRSLPVVGLLTACRTTHGEAKAVLASKLERLKKTPLRLMVDSSSMCTMMRTGSGTGLIDYLMDGLSESGPVGSWSPTPIILKEKRLRYRNKTIRRRFDANYPEYTAIIDFLTRCIAYVQTRGATCIMMCLRLHPAEHNFLSLAHLDDHSGCWEMLFEPHMDEA